MGAITDIQEDQSSVGSLKAFFELCPHAKAHISHHCFNSLCASLLSVEIAIDKYDDPSSKEEIRNHLHRIKLATEHIIDDLRRIGL